MKKTKFIALIMLLVRVSTFLTGCVSVSGMYSKLKYGAKMYSQVQDWILPSFLDEHKVCGVSYENPDYVEGVDDYTKKYYYDQVSPNFWTFIIEDQETFNQIFKENTLEVDFDTEMVFLHIFSGSSNEYIIDMVGVEAQKACVYYKSKLRFTLGVGASAPSRSCLIVKMSKMDITNVDFIEVKGGFL